MTTRPFAHGLGQGLIAIAAGLAFVSAAQAAPQTFYADSTTALTPVEERESGEPSMQEWLINVTVDPLTHVRARGRHRRAASEASPTISGRRILIQEPT